MLGVAAAAMWLWWPSVDPAAVEADAPADAPHASPAADPAQTQALTAQDEVQLRGLVHRRGQPVAHATVTLKGRGRSTTQSSADGTFAITVPEAGDYLVSALHGDEASEVLGPISLGSGAPRQVSLELLPAATVSGVVKDAQSLEPIEGATIASSAGVTQSDRAGRFHLGSLPPGPTWFEVSANGYVPRTEWLGLSGARAHSGLVVLLGASAQLSGVVTRQGKPVAMAQVRGELESSSRGGEVCGPVSSGIDGTWSLECPEGAVQLAAAAPFGSRVEGPRVRAEPKRTLSDIHIELGEALMVEGLVKEREQALAGAALTLIDARGQQVVAAAATGADGRFRFSDVPVGRYLVQVAKGALSAQAGPFEQNGDGQEWLVVVDSSRTLKGRVQPGQSGVRVRWRSGAVAGDGMATATDELGRFEFDGVSSGTLVLEAEGPQGAAHATAKAGDDVVLVLEPSAINVLAVDEQDHAVTDYLLEVKSLTSGELKRISVLSPDGRFRADVSPGRWQLFATASGHAASSSPIVEVRGSPEVKLTLPSAAPLKLIALDAQTRTPVAGVEAMFQVYSPGRYYAPARRVGPFYSAGNGELIASGVPAGSWVFARRHGQPVGSAPIDRLPKDSSGRLELPVARQPDPNQKPPPEVTEYEGIGAQLAEEGPRVYVWYPFPGSPAENAGLLHGDTIAAVDGQPARAPASTVIPRIMGPAGSLVTLTVVRDGKTLDFTLRRRAIRY